MRMMAAISQAFIIPRRDEELYMNTEMREAIMMVKSARRRAFTRWQRKGRASQCARRIMIYWQRVDGVCRAAIVTRDNDVQRYCHLIQYHNVSNATAATHYAKTRDDHTIIATSWRAEERRAANETARIEAARPARGGRREVQAGSTPVI